MRPIVQAAALMLVLLLLPFSVGWGKVEEKDYLALFKEYMERSDSLSAAWTAVPDSLEMQIGMDIADQMERTYKVVWDRRANRARNIGAKLVPFVSRKDIVYTFKVIEADSIINAVSVPGGNVWVTTGLLNFVESDDELAGVIGHEIGHVDLRHPIQGIQFAMMTSRFKPEYVDQIQEYYAYYNRAFAQLHEIQADKMGASLMYRAGYDPTKLVYFFGKLAKIEEQSRGNSTGAGKVVQKINDLVQSHPPSKERSEALQKYIQDELKKN